MRPDLGPGRDTEGVIIDHDAGFFMKITPEDLSRADSSITPLRQVPPPLRGLSRRVQFPREHRTAGGGPDSRAA